MLAVSYVKYIVLIFFHLFTGWGEEEDAYGWLRTGEDMCGVPWNCNFSTDSAQNKFYIFS
jgi:hypothetical protein